LLGAVDGERLPLTGEVLVLPAKLGEFLLQRGDVRVDLLAVITTAGRAEDGRLGRDLDRDTDQRGPV